MYQQLLGNSEYFKKKEIIIVSIEIWENRQIKEKGHAYGFPVSGSLSPASQLMLTVLSHPFVPIHIKFLPKMMSKILHFQTEKA